MGWTPLWLRTPKKRCPRRKIGRRAVTWAFVRSFNRISIIKLVNIENRSHRSRKALGPRRR